MDRSKFDINFFEKITKAAQALNEFEKAGGSAEEAKDKFDFSVVPTCSFCQNPIGAPKVCPGSAYA